MTCFFLFFDEPALQADVTKPIAITDELFREGSGQLKPQVGEDRLNTEMFVTVTRYDAGGSQETPIQQSDGNI